MNKDFDFFLLLSALAILLVLWLIVRTLKGHSQNPPVIKNTEGGEQSGRRIDRVQVRKDRPRVEEKKVDPEPKPRRALCYCFRCADGQPFAVIRVTAIGAQTWGVSKHLSLSLLRFIDRCILTEPDESLLIHLIRKADPNASLTVEAFDEKGNALSGTYPSGLKVSDFPIYHSFDHDELRSWTLESLSSAYREAFRRCQAHEMASLIKAESARIDSEIHAQISESFLLAQRYLKLIQILKEKDFYRRSSLWISYWLLADQSSTHTCDELNRLERLVISQTFVQTQKLPFLLICTPKSSGKCYNALNY